MNGLTVTVVLNKRNKFVDVYFNPAEALKHADDIGGRIEVRPVSERYYGEQAFHRQVGFIKLCRDM